MVFMVFCLTSISITIKTKYKATDDINKEIKNTLLGNNFNLLLVGAAKNVFTNRIIDNQIKMFSEEDLCNIGIFMEKNFTQITKALILLNFDEDYFLLEYGKNLLTNIKTELAILDINNQNLRKPDLFSLYGDNPAIEIYTTKGVGSRFLNNFNLVIVSFDYWIKLNSLESSWIQNSPSILIIRQALSLHSNRFFLST